MDEVVQQNASLVEEAAATSENLSGEAEEMQRLMGSFKVDMTKISSDRGKMNAGNFNKAKTVTKEKQENIVQAAPVQAAQTVAANKQEADKPTDDFAEF